ncbi:AAA family ATPase [Thermococcus sp.]
MAWARKFPKKRFLYPELKRIEKGYYVGVKGLRGVGKTVLILQFALETKKSVYFSSNSTPIKPFSLYEVVKALSSLGYRNVFIDEIHRKPYGKKI